MTTPSSAPAASRAPPPVELSRLEIAQLRNAADWARRVAVIGFVLCGAAALVYLALMITRRAGALSNVTDGLYLAVSIIGGVGAAALISGYGQSVRSFLRHGEPTLAQAFRRLRLFFTLWTLLGVLDILFDILSLLGER